MTAVATPEVAQTPGLLQVCDLTVEYPGGRRRPPVRAVDGVTLRIAPRETVGVVGESGSGKTTIGRAILGLAPITHGSISFDGADITHAGHRRRRALSSDLQVVFQDPYNSLNPARTIGQTLREAVHAQSTLDRGGVAERVRQMLGRVGLPADAVDRYPAHFSGGQRQRIAIARALMAQPRLVVCDEPVSALDVSVQASVLNLLRELQRDLELSYLFISHDLPVVRYVSHRIIVLYRGQIMEEGNAATVYHRPHHPYTQTLLNAAPLPDPDLQRARRAARPPRRAREQAPLPSGDACPFAPRCPHVIDICRAARPPLEQAADGTLVACHRQRELSHSEGGHDGRRDIDQPASRGRRSAGDTPNTHALLPWRGPGR
jgi:oligopeptide/dipeptide ABC transporter ATP-binding protein